MILNIDGLSANVETSGDKQKNAVLFLHGFKGSVESFKPVQFFLQKNHYCLNFDLWGHGKSDTADNFTIYDYANLTFKLLEKLEIERVSIVSHSFGTRIALAMAYLHPSKIDKLVITGGAGLKVKRKMPYYFKVAKFKIIKRFFPKILKNKKFGSSEYQCLDEGMKKTFKNAVNFDQSFMLKSIFQPTLLYFGEKDTATPLYMAKKFKKALKNSALIVKKNCGHFAYIENINEFNLICESFL